MHELDKTCRKIIGNWTVKFSELVPDNLAINVLKRMNAPWGEFWRAEVSVTGFGQILKKSDIFEGLFCFYFGEKIILLGKISLM